MTRLQGKQEVLRFLVGGAVRDRLLGEVEKERDWLLIGTSAAQLQAEGYRPVGQDFEVFLHPTTHEECALPRQALAGGESVHELLEGDLALRDLTINAMALADDGTLIDPFNGQRDLQAKVLRHLPGFAQDPIRVLRLARFAARYHKLGFTIARETRLLVASLCKDDVFTQLVAERVVAEIDKALAEKHADVFFKTLHELGVLVFILPDLDKLFGVPQPERYHPEIDTGVHSLMALQQACRISDSAAVRVAALLHDVGKGRTSRELWPSHIAHEERGAKLLERLADSLKFSTAWRDLCVLSARFHTRCHRSLEMKPATVLKLLEGLDAFRRGERFTQILLVCEADARGRTGFEDKPYPQAAFLQAALAAAKRVDCGAIAAASKSKEHLAQQIRSARSAAIAEISRV